MLLLWIDIDKIHNSSLGITPDPENGFVRAIKRGEKISVIFSKYWCTGILICMGLQALVSFISNGILNGFGNIDGRDLYVPYSFVYVYQFEISFHSMNINYLCERLPWNQNTILGWIGEIIFSLCMCSAYLTMNYGMLAFFMAIGEFHLAFRTHFQRLLLAIDRRSRQPIHVKTILRDSIHFHNLTKG